MNIQALIDARDVDALRKLLQDGKIIKLDGQLMTKEDHELYLQEVQQSEYYDMLQGVRKVLLRLRLSIGRLIENLVNSVKTQKWIILSQAVYL